MLERCAANGLVTLGLLIRRDYLVNLSVTAWSNQFDIRCVFSLSENPLCVDVHIHWRTDRGNGWGIALRKQYRGADGQKGRRTVAGTQRQQACDWPVLVRHCPKAGSYRVLGVALIRASWFLATGGGHFFSFPLVITEPPEKERRQWLRLFLLLSEIVESRNSCWIKRSWTTKYIQ